jgi:hypothetical protein
MEFVCKNMKPVFMQFFLFTFGSDEFLRVETVFSKKKLLKLFKGSNWLQNQAIKYPKIIFEKVQFPKQRRRKVASLFCFLSSPFFAHGKHTTLYTSRKKKKIFSYESSSGEETN